MINYVQKKKIKDSFINELFKKSIDVNQFTNNGPIKRDLEKLIHAKLELSPNKSVVCLSNGTTACHALMLFYQKKFNKKIKWAIPAFTFPTPVIGNFSSSKISDINLQTYTLDISDPSIKKCDGIIITNLFGTYSNIKEWEEFSKKQNKILIFDNASSPLSKYKHKNICEYGDSSFGSLHHTKYWGFGEGGFAVVNNEDYESLNSIANFGFTSQRIHSNFSSNYKMSDVSAAYCYSQIESYDIKKHIEIQKILIENIEKIGVDIFNIKNLEKEDLILGNLPLLFKNQIDVSSYRNLGVEANKYYKPLLPLKNSKNIFSRIINLPLNDTLTDYEIEIICKVSYEVKKQNEK